MSWCLLTTTFPVALSVGQFECLACGVHDGSSSGFLVIRLLPAMLLSVAKHRLCLFHLSMGCLQKSVIHGHRETVKAGFVLLVLGLYMSYSVSREPRYTHEKSKALLSTSDNQSHCSP
ncbi:hypothetical protein QQF64_029770 [Cirrhinus molitorella]|uniref:Uncharacterized protein n=1 Tax=Cirrhinus molitorella TaxID=172907 RepID=A0ABR3N1L0_9TELE